MLQEKSDRTSCDFAYYSCLATLLVDIAALEHSSSPVRIGLEEEAVVTYQNSCFDSVKPPPSPAGAAFEVASSWHSSLRLGWNESCCC